MSIPLIAWMEQHHGVAHSSVLREAGYTQHEMRAAVSSRLLRRVRRSWLVSASCSPERRAAAEVSGRVTCVTAAAQMGLWTSGAEGTHIAVPHSSALASAPGRTLHWAPGPVPVARFASEDPILNVLFHVARCQDPGSATATWESALRKQFVTLPLLRRTAWHSTAVDEVLRFVGSHSDSGMETRFLAIARSCGVHTQQQVLIDGHPVDALIGERLVIQLDGFEFHGSARDRRKDLRQDARLALLGYTVLRFDYQQVMFDHEYVQQTILNAIAQGLHLASRR